jgi:hypothetical protein
MNTILVQYGKFVCTSNLLFHYYLLSPCIVMCEIYLESSIAILFVFIVSNIGYEWNVILMNVMINILVFLDVY